LPRLLELPVVVVDVGGRLVEVDEGARGGLAEVLDLFELGPDLDFVGGLEVDDDHRVEFVVLDGEEVGVQEGVEKVVFLFENSAVLEVTKSKTVHFFRVCRFVELEEVDGVLDAVVGLLAVEGLGVEGGGEVFVGFEEVEIFVFVYEEAEWGLEGYYFLDKRDVVVEAVSAVGDV
jgi:hypothetical protein